MTTKSVRDSDCVVRLLCLVGAARWRKRKDNPAFWDFADVYFGKTDTTRLSWERDIPDAVFVKIEKMCMDALKGTPLGDKLYDAGHPYNDMPLNIIVELAAHESLELWKRGVKRFPERCSHHYLYGAWLFDCFCHLQKMERDGVEPSREVLLKALKDKPESEPEPEKALALPFSQEDSELGVKVMDGWILVSSRDVARVFERAHKNVLRDIQKLDCSEDFRRLNFEQSSETVETGNGTKRNFPMYFMTRDGFVFLAMGYTGKRAARFKEAYINRFNEMEKELARPASLPAPKMKRFYTPEEAAEALGYKGYRTFYAAMVSAGFFVKTDRGYRPKPEYIERGLFDVKYFRSGMSGAAKWRHPVVTHAGLLYLRKLAVA